MFLYDEPTYEECYGCEDKQEALNDIKYWFKALLGQMYGREEYDALELERCLNEIAANLGMKLPDEPLAISRKTRCDISPMLTAWKESNTQYLKSLANTGS